MSVLTPFVNHYGMLGIFILMTLESACIPIPSEAVLPYAGYLVHLHDLDFWSIVFVATIANVFGGIIAYVIGRYGGRAFIERYGRYILLNKNHLQKADQWFIKHGQITVLFGRMVPAIRTFVSLPAGIAKMPFGKFLFYSILGSIPWNIALTYAGLQLTAHWQTIGQNLKPLSDIGAVLLLVIVLWFWFGKRKRSE